MDDLGAALEQLDDRGVEADRDGAGDLDDECRARWRPAPRLAGPVAVPRPVQPEVRPQLEPAIELDQQVLARRRRRRRSSGRRCSETCGPGSRARAPVTTRPARYGRSATAILASVSPSGIRRSSPTRASSQDEPAIALDEARREQRFVVRRASAGSPSILRDDQLAPAAVARGAPQAPRGRPSATAGSSNAGSVWSDVAAAVQVQRRDTVDENDRRARPRAATAACPVSPRRGHGRAAP